VTVALSRLLRRTPAHRRWRRRAPVVNALPVVSQNQRQPPNCGADGAVGGAARDPLAIVTMETRNSAAINDLFI